MDIYILRDGAETGPFSEETTQTLLKEGSVSINDLAWQPGMPQWIPLHDVLYPTPPAASAVRPPPPPLTHQARGDVSPPAGGEPATPKQKAFLSYMGVAFSRELTKEQAALLVNDAMENPADPGRLVRWNEERLRLHPDLYQAEIQAKKENRANHFYQATQSQGADVFDNVTKAHCQVLVAFLDVHHPNWDATEHQAIWDYFFPAIAEKFPQLVRKEWKGKLKYPESRRVAPELVRRAGVVGRREPGFPMRAVVRGLAVGGAILVLLFLAYKRPWIDATRKTTTTAMEQNVAPDAVQPETKKSETSTVDLERLLAQPLPSTTATSNASSTEPSVTPSMSDRPSEPFAATAGAAPATAPPLFDATGSTGTAAAPAPLSAEPAPVQPRTTLIITKATDVQLRFGRAKLPPGTMVKFVGQDGAILRVRYGGDIVNIPVTSTDFADLPPVPPAPTRAETPAPPPAVAPPAPNSSAVSLF